MLEASTNGILDNIGLNYPNFSQVTGITLQGLDYGLTLPFSILEPNPTTTFLNEVGVYRITSGFIEIYSENGSFTILTPESLTIAAASAIPETSETAGIFGAIAICIILVKRLSNQKSYDTNS